MKLGRREFVVGSGSAVAYALLSSGEVVQGGSKMYGLIGKAITVAGMRDEFINLLVDGASEMPGCLSYIVAKDPTDANAVWITEVWDSKESHAASLKLPSVKEAIAKGRPMIAGFADHHETEPVGGHGLSMPKK